MPTVFDKDGKDIVAVRGMCIGETDASIDVNPYVQNGGFLFEWLQFLKKIGRYSIEYLPIYCLMRWVSASV